jgi:RNA polymerase sigma-70 factor (ECF subfamily)
MRERRQKDREDRKRLERLARGDTNALEEIYDIHAEKLHGLALWLLRRREDADDVVQSVLVKLAGMGADLLGIRKPRAYLLRMAHREAIDLLRRRERASDLPRGELLLARDGAGLDARAEAGRIEKKMAALDPPQREAVCLHIYLGLTFREIGRVTGVPTQTAASRYRLAIARLRREMEKA